MFIIIATGREMPVKSGNLDFFIFHQLHEIEEIKNKIKNEQNEQKYITSLIRSKAQLELKGRALENIKTTLKIFFLIFDENIEKFSFSLFHINSQGNRTCIFVLLRQNIIKTIFIIPLFLYLHRGSSSEILYIYSCSSS